MWLLISLAASCLRSGRSPRLHSLFRVGIGLSRDLRISPMPRLLPLSPSLPIARCCMEPSWSLCFRCRARAVDRMDGGFSRDGHLHAPRHLLDIDCPLVKIDRGRNIASTSRVESRTDSMKHSEQVECWTVVGQVVVSATPCVLEAERTVVKWYRRSTSFSQRQQGQRIVGLQEDARCVLSVPPILTVP